MLNLYRQIIVHIFGADTMVGCVCIFCSDPMKVMSFAVMTMMMILVPGDSRDCAQGTPVTMMYDDASEESQNHLESRF